MVRDGSVPVLRDHFRDITRYLARVGAAQRGRGGRVPSTAEERVAPRSAQGFQTGEEIGAYPAFAPQRQGPFLTFLFGDTPEVTAPLRTGITAGM